jgi:DNA-binding transcriptional regulator YiaG
MPFIVGPGTGASGTAPRLRRSPKASLCRRFRSARIVDVVVDVVVHLAAHSTFELDDLGTSATLLNVSVYLTDSQVADVRPDLGADVRARRRACGVSQVDLAQAAGVGLTSVRDLEQRRGAASLSYARLRILMALERFEAA